MFIITIILIVILSLLPVRDALAGYIMKGRKYISGALYLACILSFFFLLNPQGMRDTGNMAINVLWILLWLPILSKVFQLKLASTLMVFRRPLGVLMGTMALVHSGQYFMNEYVLLPWQQAFWIWDGQIAFTAWGFLGLIIAIILTITSNNISLKFFGGKLWKWIHRSVYVLLIFTLLHVLFLKLPGVQDSLPLMIAVFFPFVLYMIGKILEWKGVKLRKG